LAVQGATAADVVPWLDAAPKQAGKLVKEMQCLCGSMPTPLDLDLLKNIRRCIQAIRGALGKLIQSFGPRLLLFGIKA
jgi:hypothetical protein